MRDTSLQPPAVQVPGNVFMLEQNRKLNYARPPQL